jgi:excinuclease ABC subunit A
VKGGEIIAAGTPEFVKAHPESLTGKYLSGTLRIEAPNGRARRTPNIGNLELIGASLHNLRQVTATFPLGTMIVVTGVSGSGKSSLIAETLHPALARARCTRRNPRPARTKRSTAWSTWTR